MNKQKSIRFCVCLICVIGMISCILSLIYTVTDNKQYKVYYYRKNENDRQLSIKLEDKGYLLINADSIICNDADDLPFDEKFKDNYFLLLPDENTDADILSENLRIFDKHYGVKKTFVPKTEAGILLAAELSGNGITVNYMPSEIQVGKSAIHFEFEDAFSVIIDDKTTKTAVVFAGKYDAELFEENTDICAFFTRKTKNQFDVDKDTKPECNLFFTRLKKNQVADGISNTYGEKTVTVKG